MNGNVNPYIFPVSRIGNAKNPKIVILMNNPGRSPENINEMAESRMNFKNPDDSIDKIIFSEYRKECDWWDKLLEHFDPYFDDKDILSMEYYMYHTKDSKGVPKKKDWKKEAIEQLEINKSLLYDAMNRKIPIFAYYYGVWIDECKELLEYPYYSPCINHYNPAIKRKYLKNVIIPDWEKRKVIQKIKS